MYFFPSASLRNRDSQKRQHAHTKTTQPWWIYNSLFIKQGKDTKLFPFLNIDILKFYFSVLAVHI